MCDFFLSVALPGYGISFACSCSLWLVFTIFQSLLLLLSLLAVALCVAPNQFNGNYECLAQRCTQFHFIGRRRQEKHSVLFPYISLFVAKRYLVWLSIISCWSLICSTKKKAAPIEYYDSKVECVAFNCVRTIPGCHIKLKLKWRLCLGCRLQEMWDVNQNTHKLAALHQKVIMGCEAQSEIVYTVHTESERALRTALHSFDSEKQQQQQINKINRRMQRNIIWEIENRQSACNPTRSNKKKCCRLKFLPSVFFCASLCVCEQ